MDVSHYLDFVDTHKKSKVPRRTPIEVLRELSPAAEMRDQFGEEIDVSPARSA